MVGMMTDKEKALARLIQADIPLEKKPYAAIGKAVGLDEQDVLDFINRCKREGMIRKVAAIVRHQQLGYGRNAMVLWAVPEQDCEATGQLFASFAEVTHCYERTPAFEGKYNLFTMVHGRNGRLEELIGQLSALSGIRDFKTLFSEEELKKTSMRYF
jgi:DNA-binding Lrp family transcriptional regulator